MKRWVVLTCVALFGVVPVKAYELSWDFETTRSYTCVHGVCGYYTTIYPGDVRLTRGAEDTGDIDIVYTEFDGNGDIVNQVLYATSSAESSTACPDISGTCTQSRIEACEEIDSNHTVRTCDNGIT